jgi:hypothetical protein
MKKYDTANEERSMLRIIKRRKANWIGHILGDNCCLTHIIEDMIEGMGRQGRKCKQLLDDLEEKGRYWTLNE